MSYYYYEGPFFEPQCTYSVDMQVKSSSIEAQRHRTVLMSVFINVSHRQTPAYHG